MFGTTTVFAEGEDYIIEEIADGDDGMVEEDTEDMIDNEELETDEFVIPNEPMLKPSNIITVRAIGMGVAPENTISPAHAIVLAKRAAIADAYRQLGEKMYGLKINAKDTVKDAMIKSTTIRTKVNGMIRNAEIVETIMQDGLCQVEMEVRLDGRRWYRVLSGY
jgi:hypothetical protein